MIFCELPGESATDPAAAVEIEDVAQGARMWVDTCLIVAISPNSKKEYCITGPNAKPPHNKHNHLLQTAEHFRVPVAGHESVRSHVHCEPGIGREI